MSSRTTYTCDVCEVVYDEIKDVVNGPILIQITNNGQSKIYYRRHIVGHGDHICEKCITTFVRAIHSTIEGEDVAPHISDYEAVGPK